MLREHRHSGCQSLKSPDSFISHLSCLRESDEGAAGKKPLQKKKKKGPRGPNVSLISTLLLQISLLSFVFVFFWTVLHENVEELN